MSTKTVARWSFVIVFSLRSLILVLFGLHSPSWLNEHTRFRRFSFISTRWMNINKKKWEDGFLAVFERKHALLPLFLTLYKNKILTKFNIFFSLFFKKRMAAEIQSQPHATVLDYNQCPSQNQRKTISRGVSKHQLHKIDSLLRKKIVIHSCRLYFFA